MKFRIFRDKIQSLSPAVRLLDGAGLVILAALVVRWGIGGRSAADWCAALLSALLFAALGLRFVPRWVEAWRRDTAPASPLTGTSAAASARVFLGLLIADAGILLAVALLRRFWAGSENLADSLSFWRCLDSNSYLEIAQYGYAADGDRAVQLVFLPGYPLVVRALQRVIGGDFVYAGLLSAGLCFAGAGTLLYSLARLDYSEKTARRAVRYLLLFPGAFFFAAPMSESLFLLLTLGCLLCLRRKKILWACVLGGFAAFTRTIGLVMIAPVLFELIQCAVQTPSRSRRERARLAGGFLAVLLIPAGFCAYLLINRDVSGDPLRFLVYQREHWSQGLGLFFATAAYQTEFLLGAIREGNRPYIWGLFLPQLLAQVFVMGILIAACKKLRPSYTAYAIGYYVIAIGCTWLLSAVRYLGALFCVPLALGILGENKKTDRLISWPMGLFSAAYLFFFVIRWQVW